MAEGPLEGLRVLDLCEGQGALCARILADLGADVVKVEPPAGDPSRRDGLAWVAVNANKRGVTAELATADGRARFLRLAAAADVVVESFAPGRLASLGLGFPTLAGANPRLVLVSITPYGQDGPLAAAPASDLEVTAASGALSLAGDPGGPPLRTTLPQSGLWAGMYGAAGALAALAARERTGRGQHVDTSMQSAMATVLPPAPLWWDVVGDEHTRTGPYLLGRSVVGARFRNLWPSADGYVAFALQGGAIGRHTGRELARWMGERAPLPAALAAVDWDTFDNARLSQAQVDELETAVGPFLASLTKAEFYAGCVARGMLGYPVSNAADIQADPQLEARGFWQELRLADAGPAYRFPGGFALFDGARPSLRRGAPRVGEDDADAVWRAAAVPDGGVSIGVKGTVAPPSADRAAAGKPTTALAGLNVVEMGFAAAGPLVGKYLGNLGAEVIRIESSKNLDVFRATYPPYKDNQPGPDRAGMFAFYNDGTRSVTLNLKDPRGVELAKRLIARADVLVESFTPGTIERLGLGPDALRAANPGLVLLRSCNQGQTGPHARHPGYGSQLTALAGFVHLLGEKGRTPALLYGPYIDYVAVGYGLTAVLAALRQRERTGAGCVIDLSQYEAGVQFVAAAILEEQVTGSSPERYGNRDRVAAPHGSYPCAGTDRWVALSIWSDEEWRRFARVLGDPAWAADPALATCVGRRARTADLDRGIAEWTSARDRAEVVRLVRAADLRVAPVVTMSELFSDPQLVHRNAWPALPHPVIGGIHGMAPPFLLSATPARLERAGPCLGADTESVLADRLCIGAAERAALREAGSLD